MNADEIRAVVARAIRKAAPGSDPDSIAGDADIRESLDLDSMDFLSFVVAVHEALHVDIPERDYPKMFTIDGAVAYLEGK